MAIGRRVPGRRRYLLAISVVAGLLLAGCTEDPLGAPWQIDDPSDGSSVQDPGDAGDSDDSPGAATAPADECGSPDSSWIWCDDFEEDRLDSYFEYSDVGGSFVRTGSVGFGESTGMRARFQQGQVEAGGLRLAFGRTPQPYFDAVDSGTEDYREIYWRVYLRHEADWIGGGGGKLSRATSIVGSDWSQSMIAHVWSGGSDRPSILLLDPASGTSPSGSVITTKYNDFSNLRWLGGMPGATPLFHRDQVGEWYCIEAHVRLNDAGSSNGVFELWIDGEREVRTQSLNWLGSYDDYGINAVFLENYWNEGSLQVQERYFDRFVVSTERIGC